MKIYDLIRAVDLTGVSGTGRVAQAIEFDSGKVAVAWCASNHPRSVAVYDTLDEAKLVHGHSGTEFVEVINVKFALSALDSLQKTLDSHNAENPWLGVCAAAVLLTDENALMVKNRKLEAALSDAIGAVASGQVGHSYTGQVYCPRIGIDEVERWREAFK